MTLETISFFLVALEWGLGAFALLWYLTRARRTPERNTLLLRRVIGAGVVLFLLFALVTTFFQYAAWEGDPLSSNLLPPHQSILYFIKYAGTHFWLTPTFSLIVSVAFYGFLVLLKRRNERFFEEGEMELGALSAFLVGWPRVVVFIPVAFLAVVVISGIKLALRKNAYTTLGTPFLIGLLITLVCGYAVLQSLGLESIAVIPGAR
ncbi:MAG: hypothetical protein V1885_00580 [Candidatus Brennerbacteria bacterium]